MRDLKSKLKMPAKRPADMEVEEDLSLEGLDLEEESDDSDPAMSDEVTSTDSEVEAGGAADLSDDELLAEVKARGLKLEDVDAEMPEDSEVEGLEESEEVEEELE
jgi:hypothetical protein